MPRSVGLSEARGRGGFFRQPNPDEIPEEYRKMLGRVSPEKTIAQLKKKPKFPCPSCGGDCDLREAVIWAEAHARKSWLKRVA